MEQSRLPLYAFFLRLRTEAGIELDARQYYGFLKSFTALHPIDSPQQLLELCKIHWLSRPQYEKVFEEIFKDAFRKEAEALFSARAPEPEPRQELPPKSKPAETGETVKEPARAEPPPPPADKKPEPAPPSSEPLPESRPASIYIHLKESQGAASGPGPLEIGGPAFLDNDFIFSDKYLPASGRRMKQNWRYLKALAEKVPGKEIDIPGTVEDIGRNGLFTEPVFLPSIRYHQRILFLIDHGGSMAAFETLAEHLVTTIRESLRVEQATSLYFHNYPEQRLFLDPYQQRSVELPDLLRQTPRHSTLAFIISDAGAARGNVHPRRIDATRTFLEQLRLRVPHLLWLNPMPRRRWQGSSAMYLSFFVDMLEASKDGFRKLPEKLKHL